MGVKPFDKVEKIAALAIALGRKGKVVKYGTGQIKKTVAIPITGGTDTAGGVGSWVNTENAAVIVNRVTLDVTTKATSACTLDIGYTATSATTSADNFIDGVDVGTATGTFDNINDAGTNGKSLKRIAVGKWITLSTASGASAGLVGTLYIEYVALV